VGRRRDGALQRGPPCSVALALRDSMSASVVSAGMCHEVAPPLRREGSVALAERSHAEASGSIVRR
jgi:hypothetical protein